MRECKIYLPLVSMRRRLRGVSRPVRVWLLLARPFGVCCVRAGGRIRVPRGVRRDGVGGWGSLARLGVGIGG